MLISTLLVSIDAQTTICRTKSDCPINQDCLAAKCLEINTNCDKFGFTCTLPTLGCPRDGSGICISKATNCDVFADACALNQQCNRQTRRCEELKSTSSEPISSSTPSPQPSGDPESSSSVVEDKTLTTTAPSVTSVSDPEKQLSQGSSDTTTTIIISFAVIGVVIVLAGIAFSIHYSRKQKAKKAASTILKNISSFQSISSSAPNRNSINK